MVWNWTPSHVIFKAYTVGIRYLKYPLSRTFTMSNFLFSSFRILINFHYKTVWYLELRYPELSLCCTIFSVHSVIFGLFLIRYLEHSNEIFEWIILFISGIQMLITTLTKLYPEVYSFFSSSSFWQQHVKTQWKKFRREKCQALRDLEKGPKTKPVP